ncbi:MAG: trimethylamine methyltransferase family protein [Deltaproteobacteria bacterium]|jgi:trimethylamine--corrinoid protein Co-methyltransferase|nr:trimethylamine methyltransferase family protein [Deltaproteobacteria bacterium]
MQWYEFLTQPQVEQVHEASMWILANVGIDLRYAPALEVMKKGGARIDGERVFLPAGLVEEQIRKAPAEFTLHARDSDFDVVIGGQHMVFTPGYGATFVADLDHGRREGTLNDFENFVKLTDASPYQDICSGMFIEPSDVPHEIRHVQMIYTAMKNSAKPIMGSAMGVQGAMDSIMMASIVFGSQGQLSQKPRMISILCSLTPLVYDERMLGAIMEYARAGQPQLISSLAIAGATSPATLAGTLAVQNAEVLAGIVLAQLIREGTPVVMAGASTNADMHTGALSTGSPEMALNTAATAQMARFYGLPVRGGGAVCDAKYPDAQAAYESMMSLLTARFSGVNFVLHSAGILDSYNCMSYEKFIIDDEMCGMVKRMQKGYDVNPDTLGLDLIREVGPGGHFLDKDHTFDHFRTEFYQPQLSSREDFFSWQASGSRQSVARANKKYKEILETHEAQPLPADVDEDLLKFIEKLT